MYVRIIYGKINQLGCQIYYKYLFLTVQELRIFSPTDHGRIHEQTDSQVDYRAHAESRTNGRSVDFSAGHAINEYHFLHQGQALFIR